MFVLSVCQRQETVFMPAFPLFLSRDLSRCFFLTTVKTPGLIENSVNYDESTHVLH